MHSTRRPVIQDTTLIDLVLEVTNAGVENVMAKKAKFASEGSLVEILRKAVALLNQQADIVRGVLYHTLPGSMNDRVATMGVVNVAHFVLLLQELGLLRKWGGGTVVVWQVVEMKFFDEVVAPEWLERAQVCLQKHMDTTEDLRLLKARISALEGASNPGTSVGEKSLIEIGALVVELEGLRTQLATSECRVAELERALAERPAFDADAALALAIKRARGLVA